MAQQQQHKEPHKKLGEIKRKTSLSIHDARIAGLYDLEHTIGQGHFAVVKLARHVFTGEKVAVKVIDKTKLDPVSTAHIMQEVRCMKLVQHPNIVRLYEVIDTQTKLFLILELGDYDMHDFIMRYSDIGCSEVDAQQHFNQIIKAIDYCHTLHVVHRDLKPENVVFFEKLGMVKLTDFGFSNLFTPGQQLETSCGSLAYSAPEILLGDAYDAPAVDVWSLGVILFMLVCGRLPFQEANDPETLTKILDCKFSLPDTLSEDCKSLIKRMLVREPSKRATLAEIVASTWVKAGDRGHAETLPLISREQLSDCAHATIIEQMIAGGIGTEEDIHNAIESDDYSYITATYYLLAERVLSKHRERQAQELLIIAARSEPRLDNTVARSDSQESASSSQSGTTPATTTPSHAATGQSTSSAVRSRSRSNSFRRHRPCSILKEESEEELSHYLRSSRQSSRNSSPSMSMFGTSPANKERFSPQAIQELLEFSSTRIHSGRRTPESHRSSRSPSPPSSSGRTSPSVAALVTRLKQNAPGPGALRKLSSSPHLIGICEESEEASEGGASSSTVATFMKRTHPPQATYSSVRMIRQRQAVVSPDVIRRYENRVFATNRSRRSTSCSSSEASDDDSERRYNLIGSRYCRRPGDDDGDDEPPIGGNGRGGSRRRHHSANLASTSEAGETDGAGGDEKTTAAGGNNGSASTAASTCRDLDAGKLIGKLQKLVLHPIREIPSATSTLLARLFARSTAASRVAEWWQHCAQSDEGSTVRRVWFQRLRKPKSCENVFQTAGVVVDNTSAGAQYAMVFLCKDDAFEAEEDGLKSSADSGVSSTAVPDSQTESDQGDSEDSVEDDGPAAKRKPPHTQQHHKLTKRARAALHSQALASSRVLAS